MQIQFSDTTLKCPQCEKGYMLPFEDFSSVNSSSSAVVLKGWVCSNKSCRNSIFFQGGSLRELAVIKDRER